MAGFNEKVISVRPDSSIPPSLQKKVDLILLNKQSLEWAIFGSSMYRIQKYYGDIDVRESFTSNKSVDDIVKKVAMSLQKMVREINKRQLTYFSEVKAGIDVRYAINIGTLENGIYIPSKSFLVLVEEYKNIGLFSENEYSIIIDNLIDSNLDAHNYDIIYNVVRERRILRWSGEEILNGFKTLPLGLKINLADACKMKSIVKIDYITILNNNFIEITNIMFLGKKNKDGSITLINVSDEYPEPYIYSRQIRDEIEALFYSDYYRSPFKGSKRFYALARSFYIASEIVNDEDKKIKYSGYINQILPVIKGDISQLYQAKSFLSSLSRLLQLGYNVPDDAINNQLDILQFSLPNILFFPDNLIDALNAIFSLIRKEKINKKKTLCDIVTDVFTNWINTKTIMELNKVNLNPIPSEFLPRDKSYVINKLDPMESIGGIHEVYVSEADGYTYIFDNNFDLLFKTRLSPDKVLNMDKSFPKIDDSFDSHENDNAKEQALNGFLIRNIDVLNSKQMFNELNSIYNDKIALAINDSKIIINNRGTNLAERVDNDEIEDIIDEIIINNRGTNLAEKVDDDIDVDSIKPLTKKQTKKSKTKIIKKIRKNCCDGNYEAIYNMISKN